MPEPDPIADLLEHLAERQWRRMTRSSTAWDDLNESDRRACRALIKPVLDDIAEIQADPSLIAKEPV